MMAFDGTTGKISEWNEATFKAMRLHEVQQILNNLKMDPVGKTNGKFNYIWIARIVNSLYLEGYSKYKTTERDEVDKITKIVFNFLRFNPPHQKVMNDSLRTNNSITYNFNEKNLEFLMDLLDLFEKRIKDLNDTHGLTTKNKGPSGLF